MIKQLLNRYWLSQNIVICQCLADKFFCLSLRLRQIIDMLATDKSQYFAQLRPISVKYAHLASTRFRIHSVFKTLHSGAEVTDSYAAFIEYVWTEVVSGKKEMRIKKYPDTRGCSLRTADVFPVVEGRPEIRLLFAG